MKKSAAIYSDLEVRNKLLHPCSPASRDLHITASSFESKIKKRLHEQNFKNEEAQKTNNNNRYIILQSLNTIRQALNEISSIDLGQRFNLDLEIDDLNGWPRLELCLIDQLSPEQHLHNLNCSVFQRADCPVIELRSYGGSVNLHLDVINDNKQDLLLTVKKSIRLFLDEIEGYILNPSQVEEAINHEDESGDVEKEANVAALEATELFDEDLQLQNRNQITFSADDKNIELPIKLDQEN